MESSTTTKSQGHNPFKYYKTDLNFKAWTEQQYVLKRCATRPVKLLHRLKYVHSVVVPNSKTDVVVEVKESLVGIKYVADDKPTSILSALIDLQLVNHDATCKWTDLLDKIMSRIHRAVADDCDNSGGVGDLGRCQQLVVVDIVSSKKYCCFEEVADNEALLMST